LFGRRELTPEDVRKLVFESIGLIDDAQRELDLPICPNIQETKERLEGGRFRVTSLPLKKTALYQMVYGSFDPPATITLDCDLPFCDWPLDIPDFPRTMARYAATHEVIHADDHLGGDATLTATTEHILDEHLDKLERGMEIIDGQGGCDSICCYRDLAGLWATQYVDMITHYRTYVTLRHRRLPRLDMIWACMQDGFFPPNLLTQIEGARDTEYIFDVIIGRAGEYCLIDALMESESIGERKACSYAV
jgi:hypothetical protein